MIQRRMWILFGIVIAVIAAAWVYLDQVLLPRASEGLAKAFVGLADVAITQGARVSPPELVPPGSRILFEGQPIGDLILSFRIGPDPSVPKSGSRRASGLLRAFHSPDSSTVFSGELSSRAAAAILHADSDYVALVSKGAGPEGSITIRIVRPWDVVAPEPSGYLWLPADSLFFAAVASRPIP